MKLHLPGHWAEGLAEGSPFVTGRPMKKATPASVGNPVAAGVDDKAFNARL
jgi:hypothetical protein